MKFQSLSESAVVIYFGDNVEESTLLHISAFNKAIHAQPFSGFLETVPAFVSLTVYFDPFLVIGINAVKGRRAYQMVINYLEILSSTLVFDKSFVEQDLVHIPVCYDEVFGLDLADVAQYNRLSIDEVINIHCSTIYTVYMIGFMPGFPYLGGMSSKIATPRKDFPRTDIQPGTVGIGGEQTGIYPLNSPGGWQLIGRTPILLFNMALTQPSLLKAGQSVKFYPINQNKFKAMSEF